VSLKDLQERLEIKGTNIAAKSSLKYTLNFTGQYDKERSAYTTTDQSQLSESQVGYDFQLISEPFERGESAQYYSVIVGKGLGCQNCEFPLEDPLTVSVSVEPKHPLTVQYVRSNNEGELIDLRIDFSHTV